MIKINLQFFASKSAVDKANDQIDSYKQAYETAKANGDTKGMEEAHAGAEAVRSSMASQGYTAGNYVQSASKSSVNDSIDKNNYSYDASTNYSRVYEPEEEPIKQSPSMGFNDLVNQYADAKKQAQINQLNKSYNNVLNQIASSEQNANDNARASGNRASVQNQLQTARLNRQFANAGLANSGTSAQMNINQAGALQNSLSDIDNTRNKALSELQNQRLLAKSNLESDINSVNQNIDAQTLQMQYERLLNQEQMAQQLANQKELLAMQEDYNNIWDDTLGRYVPFSYYATTHNIGGTSTSVGSNNSNNSPLTLTQAQYDKFRKEYNESDFAGTFEDYMYYKYPNYVSSGYQPTVTKNGDKLTTYDDLPAKTKNLAKINEAIMNGQITFSYLYGHTNELYSAGLNAEEISEVLDFAKQYENSYGIGQHF